VCSSDLHGEVVWTSTAGDGAARARLRDTGNLAVEDDLERVLWQSFDHPTDTLLPDQSVGLNGLVSSGRLLEAGHYGFRFSDYAMLSLVYDDGGEVSSIYWPNPYFSYWQNSRKIYNFSRQADFDSSGHFLASDNATFDAADLGVAGVSRRLTLDTDGNLRMYSLDTRGETWTVSWMAFPNPCTIHGVCGANALCVYTPSPSCVCAPGHERADRSDWSRGCRPTFRNSTGDQVKFVELPHTDFWGFDLNNSEFLSLDACRAQCVNEPSCVVFQYKQGKGECYPKSLMFKRQDVPRPARHGVPQGPRRFRCAGGARPSVADRWHRWPRHRGGHSRMRRRRLTAGVRAQRIQYSQNEQQSGQVAMVLLLRIPVCILRDRGVCDSLWVLALLQERNTLQAV